MSILCQMKESEISNDIAYVNKWDIKEMGYVQTGQATKFAKQVGPLQSSKISNHNTFFPLVSPDSFSTYRNLAFLVQVR